MINPSSTPSLIDLISLSGGAIDGHVITELEAAGFHGLRVRHGYVVQRLIAGDRTVTDIARSLGVSQQAISKTVAELERLGYIGRSVDPDDARRRSLALTEHGIAAIERARGARAALLARVEVEVGRARITDAEEVMRVILDLFDLRARVDERRMPVPAGS